MMKRLAIVLVLVSATTAFADAPVKKGFWKILVKPGAKWTLYDTIEREKQNDRKKVPRLVVETYDTRKVGAADVARLRWTLFDSDGKKSEHGCEGCYTQVAVTSAGMYIVSDAKDDAQIAASLKAKPSRSDPPKSYSAKNKSGRYLNVSDSLVCYGENTNPGPDPCDDTCFGEICISPDKGIVQVEGLWAPGVGIYEADGFKR